MIKEPFLTHHQSNLLLAELSESGNCFHHIIGWGNLNCNRVPITASIEPQSAFERAGGWGIHAEGGFLLYDRATGLYYNPLTGDQYTEGELPPRAPRGP